MASLTSHDHHQHSNADGSNEDGNTQSDLIEKQAQEGQAPTLGISDATPLQEPRDDQGKGIDPSVPLDANTVSREAEVNELPVGEKDLDDSSSAGCKVSERDPKVVSVPAEDSMGAAACSGEGVASAPKAGDEIAPKDADSEGVTKEKKKPLLYPYKPADMSFWDSMQRHREGTDEPAKQPPVKTTKVVKRNKVQTTVDLLAKLRSAPVVGASTNKGSNVAQQAKAGGAKRVVVVVEGSAPPTPSGEGTTSHEDGLRAQKETVQATIIAPNEGENNKGTVAKPSEAAASANTKKEPSTHPRDVEGTAHEGTSKPLSLEARPEATPATVTVSSIVKKTKPINLPATVVRQGAVHKRVKASQKAPKEAARETHITAVKVDPLIQELRAHRNKPLDEDKSTVVPKLAVDASTGSSLPTREGMSVQKSQGNVDDIHEEISKLLLDYCWSGEESAKGDDAAEHLPSFNNNEKPCPEIVPDSSGHTKRGEGIAVGATDTASRTGPNADKGNPEMMLYNRVIQICQREDVTPTILEVLYELIKHTRVIKLPSSSVPKKGSVPGQEHSNPDESHNSQDNIQKRRRQYAQQVILVLINQVRQQKLNEVYRRQLLHDQQQIAAEGKHAGGVGLAAQGFSAFSGLVSKHDQPQKTFFFPQGNHVGSALNPAAAAFSGPLGPPEPRPTAMNPNAEPFRAKAAPQPAPPACTVPLDDSLVSLLEAFKQRLLHWTTAAPLATVSVTTQERQALREMQQSFQHAIMAATVPSPAPPEKPARETSSKGKPNTWSFVAFDSSNETSPSLVGSHPCQASSQGDGGYVTPPPLCVTDTRARTRHPPGLHRTVFTYKTVPYSTDENSPSVWSYSEPNPAGDAAPALTPSGYPNVAAAGLQPAPLCKQEALKDGSTPSAFNCDAEPFIPGGGASKAMGVMKGMNANAPAFTPASLSAMNSASVH